MTPTELLSLALEHAQLFDNYLAGNIESYPDRLHAIETAAREAEVYPSLHALSGDFRAGSLLPA